MSDPQKKKSDHTSQETHILFLKKKTPRIQPQEKNGSGPYLTKIPDPDPPPWLQRMH